MIINYLLIGIGAILSAAPVLLLKKYINDGEHNIILVYLSIIASILIVPVYLYLCRLYDVSIIYTIIKIASILIVVLIGFYYLKEKLSIIKIIGIILGIIALLLLIK